MCRCDCGYEAVKMWFKLKSNNTKCRFCDDKARCKDYTGQTINNIKFLYQVGKNNQIANRSARWMVQCYCGKLFTVNHSGVIYGNTRSCGCYKIAKHKLRCGPNHPLWKSDKSEEDRKHARRGQLKWAKLIKEKYNYICQICHRSHKTMDAHHIQSYNNNVSLRTDVNNGICLCQSCHTKFHKKYGKGNNNIKQLEEFANEYSSTL